MNLPTHCNPVPVCQPPLGMVSEPENLTCSCLAAEFRANRAHIPLSSDHRYELREGRKSSEISIPRRTTFTCFPLSFFFWSSCPFSRIAGDQALASAQCRRCSAQTSAQASGRPDLADLHALHLVIAPGLIRLATCVLERYSTTVGRRFVCYRVIVIVTWS